MVSQVVRGWLVVFVSLISLNAKEIEKPMLQDERFPPQVIKVEDFGAKGDGKTNDRYAIMKAIRNAGYGDKVVFRHNATYLIEDGSIPITKNGIILEGNGATLVREPPIYLGKLKGTGLVTDMNVEDCILAVGSLWGGNNVTIRNLKLRSNYNTPIGIIVNASGVKIENCKISRFMNALIHISSSKGKNICIEGCDLSYSYNGISWNVNVHASDYRILKNHIHRVRDGIQINTPGRGWKTTYSGGGPQREYLSKGGSSNIWIIGNTIEYTGFRPDGFSPPGVNYKERFYEGTGISLSRVSNLIIRHNRFLHIPRTALHIEAFSHDIDFSYNYVESAQFGIIVYYGGPNRYRCIAREYADKVGVKLPFHAVHGPKYNIHIGNNEIYAGECAVFIYTHPKHWDPRTGNQDPQYNWYVHDNIFQANPSLIDKIQPWLKEVEGRPMEPAGWWQNLKPIKNLDWRNNKVTSFVYVEQHGEQNLKGNHEWFEKHKFFQDYLRQK